MALESPPKPENKRLDTDLVPVIAEQYVMQQLMPAPFGEAVYILGGRSLG
jgi:hypothetical protein